MTDATNKPVIFLAFANDRDDTVGYLRNLPDEARRLRDVLEPAEQAGLCEVVVRSNSTAGDIFKVFQDPKYRNRIGILHYGGHANGYQLLLESATGQAAADAGGLAKFLGQQQGLHLVFLNGCSTQQQTEGLLEANISAVISTSRAIEDQVATDFSHQFYQALAGGASIRTAYNEAEASVQTSKGGNTRGLYFGNKDDASSQPEADRWPWNLYLREGSESADQWNLPEAVNDPLFGLPSLPEQDLPESPYRHLNWFTRKDAEVFFGRGHQIRELYDRLTAPRTAPIMLFYGQSGVGKSSILDAGLIPRLEQDDYEVRYLRRTEGGLLDTLQLAFLPEASDVPIETAWRVKEEQTGKPLIVFLDQVEELYTRPVADVPDELEQLLEVVKATFVKSDQRPRGKLVLGFRKEWLAELEAQLVNYELPRTKVFLESLDRRGIIEVVQGPNRSERLHERYGLTVEDGLAEIIVDDLLADRDSAIAPTLQILLTKMWSKATEENYEHPQFSQELYQHLKRDGILLRDFLNQQIAAFRERYPEVVDSGLLVDIVALHTTPLGTAGECTVEQLQQQYAHLGSTLPDLIQQCQDLHLLTVATRAQKETTKTTRLAHDTLAPLVREQFDESDKPGQRARRILDNRSVDWSSDQTGTPLDEADLKVVEKGVAGTRVLSATEQRLVEASRDLRARLQRTRKFQKIAAAALVVIIVVVAGIAVWEWRDASITRLDALKGQIDALVDSISLATPTESVDYIKKLEEASTREPLSEYAIMKLYAKLTEPPPPNASPDEQDTLSRGKGSIGGALARMGAIEKLSSNLKHSDDPTLRSYLIHRLSQAGVKAGPILSRLEETLEPSECQALTLSLGEFDEKDFSSDVRDKLIPRLVELYSDPDPGVHAASEWLLRQWKQDGQIKQVANKLREGKSQKTLQQLEARTLGGQRRWYITPQGQTMVFIKGPVTFRMGSPKSETGRSTDEVPHDRTVDHSFSIAANEVTLVQFLKFRKAQKKAYEYDESKSQYPNDPAIDVMWYDAAAYCNWLTDEENESRTAGVRQLEKCYEPNALGEYAEGMKIATDYLQRGGYRLPTEAEWEYACRGGATSRYCFGEAETLLAKYARSDNNSENRSGSVGSLKPNGFGFFDMHGNVWEWCLDEYAEDASAAAGNLADGLIGGSDRVYRGGGWSSGAGISRSAYRFWGPPRIRRNDLGFRVACSPSGQQGKSTGAGSEGRAVEPRGAGKARPIKP